MMHIFPACKFLTPIIFLLATMVPASEILAQKPKSDKESKTNTPKPIKNGFPCACCKASFGSGFQEFQA